MYVQTGRKGTTLQAEQERFKQAIQMQSLVVLNSVEVAVRTPEQPQLHVGSV